MKAIIVAAVTLDGFIAHGPLDEAVESSTQDKAFAKRITKEAGVVIVGLNTFKTFNKPLADRKNVVLTHHPEKQSPQLRTIFTKDPPKKILNRLASQDFKQAVVYGGGQIFELFLKANLVDTMYLTITPRIFKHGIAFPYQAVTGRTQLKTTRPLGRGEFLFEIEIL